MALDTIPPWLQTNPQEWGNLANAGARLDVERQNIANAQQQVQRESAQKQMQIQMLKDQQDREYNMQVQQHAVDTQMKQQQLQMATQAAARKFQAQQQYQQLVQSGVDPVQAAMRIGPEMGSMVGMGQLARDDRPMPAPMPFDFGENGKGVVDGHGTWHPAPVGKYGNDNKDLSDSDKAYLGALQTQLKEELDPTEKERIMEEIRGITGHQPKVGGGMPPGYRVVTKPSAVAAPAPSAAPAAAPSKSAIPDGISPGSIPFEGSTEYRKQIKSLQDEVDSMKGNSIVGTSMWKNTIGWRLKKISELEDLANQIDSAKSGK